MGINHCLFKTAAIAFKVTVKSFDLDEELYRLSILDTLVEVFEQWLLLIVWTGGVAEIVKEEQLCAAVSFKELHLAVDTFLGLVDGLGILCL